MDLLIDHRRFEWETYKITVAPRLSVIPIVPKTLSEILNLVVIKHYDLQSNSEHFTEIQNKQYY